MTTNKMKFFEEMSRKIYFNSTILINLYQQSDDIKERKEMRDVAEYYDLTEVILEMIKNDKAKENK